MEAKDWIQIIVTALTVLLSSGIIQFFVNRKDKKKEEEKNEPIKALKEELTKGLQERSEEGKQRFDQHEKNIADLHKEHETDFMLLREAIEMLKDNDVIMSENIQKISDTQDIMAKSLIGHAHDRIIWYTDKISERGSITNSEKATINSMYDPYCALGGNGVVKENVKYVMTLPTISEEEARVADAKIRNMYSKVV